MSPGKLDIGGGTEALGLSELLQPSAATAEVMTTPYVTKNDWKTRHVRKRSSGQLELQSGAAAGAEGVATPHLNCGQLDPRTW
jgi:hypothetical protein